MELISRASVTSLKFSEIISNFIDRKRIKKHEVMFREMFRDHDHWIRRGSR